MGMIEGIGPFQSRRGMTEGVEAVATEGELL